MKRTMLMLSLILGGVAAADAQTYQWTDDNGVISYTDDINSVPTKYRTRVKKREDITTKNPKVRQELLEQERRARQDELNSPRIDRTPGVAPPVPAPPRVERPGTTSDESPPGRTKSQRIRDNIERRRIE